MTSLGSGNGTILVVYEKNPSATARNAQLTVTGSGGLSEIVEVEQSGSSLGVSAVSVNLFQVYPNPSSGIYTLVPGNASNIGMELNILDPAGNLITFKVLSGSTSYRIDIRGFPDGFYFVQLKDGIKSSIRRILKANLRVP